MQSPEWRKLLHQGADEKYAADLAKLADEEHAEYFDLQLLWGSLLRKAGRPVEDYKRDPVHANALGEAVLARILDQYFGGPLPQGDRPIEVGG
jgi:lysophospholipase L1-like esterase